MKKGKGIPGTENGISNRKEAGKSMLHMGKQKEFRHKVGSCGGSGWRGWVMADMMDIMIWTLPFRQKISAL